jgi:hypothetical protein
MLKPQTRKRQHQVSPLTDRAESIASAVREPIEFPDYEPGNSESDPGLEFRLQAELALKRRGRQLHLIII